MKISEISEREHEMVIMAEEMNESYMAHAQYAVDFLGSFIHKVKPRGIFFVIFLSQVIKHIKLALLSSARFHHVQATLDLRFALESVCWAAYGMAHTKPESFAESADHNTLEPLENIVSYKWLEEEFPEGNEEIKRFKSMLNKISTHSNIVDAYRNFSIKDDGLEYHFFDNSKDRHVKVDLWSVANLTMGALDLFYGVNGKYDAIEFESSFLEKMDVFKKENERLKKEGMKDPHFAKFGENDNTQRSL